MDEKVEEKDTLLGFLALYEAPTRDGYLGAVLITDLQGVPQEFRCTHPVKPTNIQKPLYGQTLKPYIGINLCGIPLIQSIQNKPSLFLVNEEFLLDVRCNTPCPVIFIRRAGEAIEVEASATAERPDRRQRVDCASGKFQPIVLEPHPEFNGDSTSAREILENTFNYLDPLEPFERIAKAIEVLGKQDKRFQ